ncbi:MAG: penicillin-binding transpeptidase domain-containing protein [Chloroflexota bacterium]|nr:penicillin-binding transpeptidase domain-containing protein [Chloroflexota bacterium]
MSGRLAGRSASRATVAAAAAVLVAACSGPLPLPTPVPTTVPTPAPEAARELAAAYLAAWQAGNYAAMYAMLAPSVRDRYAEDAFGELHAQLVELPGTTEVAGRLGAPTLIGLPPEPRPVDLPAPTPVPSASQTAGTSTTATPAGTPSPPGTRPVLDGPVLAMELPLDLTLATDRFGELDLERRVVLTQGADGWQVRWSPASVFPELGDAGELTLDRQLLPRGRILAADGSVLADNRDDGVRIYPQEALAGQTVGYVSDVTAEDLETLAEQGYRTGDVVGRSGLESGAEPLLRGEPGWTLNAVPDGGDPVELFHTEAVAGADVHTTLQPDVQRTAEAALARYPAAGTAVIDPASGDVWALASAPPLNPNAFTLGSTLSGVALSPPQYGQILNNAAAATYPAGSTFKPFTLASALVTGVVTPDSQVTCPGTWDFEGFTFHNYQDHELEGPVSLADAMAFSCNTTYMPLSAQVYDVDPDALPRLAADFGFGEPTGVQHLTDEAGVLPSHEYFQATEGRDYGAFDQVQLAIGQGAFLGTPLQMALAFTALGNGGTLWTPRLVTQVVQPDGTVVESFDPEERRQVAVDAGQLAYVVDTLQAVVDRPFGTAYGAFQGFGLAVAGKSGTAETSTENPDSWFAAFAPADAPTISVVTVLIEEPLSTGGADAAPLVRQVMETHFGR